MYNDYAFRQGIIEAQKWHHEKITNDPEYRDAFIKKLKLDELFSEMTEEHWKIADRKYGYKNDKH